MSGLPRQTVLLTGASGTVGGAVRAALLEHGCYLVHAIARTPLPAHPRLTVHALDLAAADFADALFHHDYDAIIHAAQPRAGESYVTANGEDFDLHVVRQLERVRSPRTKRWLYTSGVWIYGHQTADEAIRETSPFRPFTAAGSRVGVIEHLRNPATPPWVEVVLPSLVYGPGGTLGELARGICRGDAQVIDEPDIHWSLIAEADVGRLYRQLLDQDYTERCFVAAEPESVAICNVHARIAAALHVPFQPLPRERLRAGVSDETFALKTGHQPVDSRLVRERIGWTPRQDFRRDLPELIRALRRSF